MSWTDAATVRSATFVAFAAAAVVAGCGKPGNFSPAFRLNMQGRGAEAFRATGSENDAEKQDKESNIQSRQFISDALAAMFGTPDRPFVFRESGLDLRKIRMASGPAGGSPQAVRQDELTSLKKREGELKAGQPNQDAEVKKLDADILTNLTKFASDKGLTNVKTPADLKENEAAFREQFKSVFDAKASADAKLAGTAGELADLDLEIKSYGVAQKGLYRQHCAHCHGTTGDGAGPTAAFLTPYPRDYRKGIYKFKSTSGGNRPTDADLRRIITDGINDTAMPSFALLPPDEIDALVEYVKYLSIRGETESFLAEQLFDARSPIEPRRSQLVEVGLQPAVASWQKAATTVVTPPEEYKPPEDRAKWIKAGADLFAGDKAKCFNCHGTTGLGDGRKQSEPLYDIWNKDKGSLTKEIAQATASLSDPNLKPEEIDALKKGIEQKRKILASYDLPLQAQSPRNLRQGKYRFGRRPVDIYRRIVSGINGTEMPGGGAKEGAKSTLSETEIWQLVDYVLSLPYELDTHAPAAKTQHHAAQGEAQTEKTGG